MDLNKILGEYADWVKDKSELEIHCAMGYEEPQPKTVETLKNIMIKTFQNEIKAGKTNEQAIAAIALTSACQMVIFGIDPRWADYAEVMWVDYQGQGTDDISVNVGPRDMQFTAHDGVNHSGGCCMWEIEKPWEKKKEETNNESN